MTFFNPNQESQQQGVYHPPQQPTSYVPLPTPQTTPATPSYFTPTTSETQNQQNHLYMPQMAPGMNYGGSPDIFPSVNLQVKEELEMKKKEVLVDLQTDVFPTPTIEDYKPRTPLQVTTSWLSEKFNCAQSDGKFIQTTLTHAPGSHMMNFPLPFGAVMQPFAPSVLPVLQTDPNGEHIVRCESCRTYVNPFFQFSDDGRKFKCNVCHHVSGTPDYYVCEDDNVRKMRVELQVGSMDFVAPQDYSPRAPQPAAYLFLIDVSKAAVLSGYSAMVSKELYRIISNGKLAGDERTQIGIITYGEKCHFYNLDEALQRPKMMVIGDLKSTQELLPYPRTVLVNLLDSKKVVLQLLKSLPRMFPGEDNDDEGFDNCLGTALNAAGAILGRVGGKMIVFLGGMPSIGAHNLNRKTTVIKKKKNNQIEPPLAAFIPDYQKLGDLYSREQITVSLFAASKFEIDLCSIVPMVRLTGGNFHYYADFPTRKNHFEKIFRNNLKNDLCGEMGFEHVMRIRIGPFLKVKSVYGNVLIRGKNLIVSPVIGMQTSVACEFEMKSPKKKKGEKTRQEVYIDPTAGCGLQVAWLYTTPDGERRIRVHNAMLPVAKSIPTLFQGINVAAMGNVLMRRVMCNVLKRGEWQNQQSALLNLLRLSFDLLNRTTGQAQPGMMPMNEYPVSKNFKKLIVYFFGILRNGLFNPKSSNDDRITAGMLQLSDSVLSSYLLNVPAFFDIEKSKLLRLTRRELNGEGVYLAITHNAVFLFIGFGYYKKKKDVYDDLKGIIDWHNDSICREEDESDSEEMEGENTNKSDEEEDIGEMAKNVKRILTLIRYDWEHVVPAFIVHLESDEYLIHRLNSTLIEDGWKEYQGTSYLEFVRSFGLGTRSKL